MPGSRPRFRIATRSTGAQAVKRAAYRSGERLEDHTYGETHDFSRKGGILHSEIMAPENAPEWMRDRQALWNAVEQAELKKDGSLKMSAQLARDVVVPLPHELSVEDNKALLREWIAGEFVSKGMVADFSIHEADRGGDGRNVHAHLMLTMREIDGPGFHKAKSTAQARSWNSTELLTGSIDRFQDMQNRELERRGIEARADFSSFEKRGIDREPQQHEGPAVTAMRRRDEESRVSRANDDRERRNTARAAQHVAALKELAAIAAERQRFEDWAAQKAGQLEGAQALSRLDLARAQDRISDDHEARLQAFYAPHLKTVEAEAAKIRQRQEARGIFASLRRVWTGRGDRDRLEQLEATISDTHTRMQEVRDALANRQAVERAQLMQLQEKRRAQQHEGIERARERKEDTLAARLARAQERAPENAQERGPPRSLEDRLREADASQKLERQERSKSNDNEREM